MNVQTPTQQAAHQHDLWDREWKEAMKAKTKLQADRIFADPLTLALIVSEHMDDEPMKWGYALQALAKGDAMQIQLLATAAVFESVTEAL